MPACTVCGHENAYGALSCVRCYSLLVQLTADQRSKIESNSTVYLPTSDVPETTRAARQSPAVGAGSIALYIDDSAEPLLVPMSRQAILGRYSPQGSAQPRIDLTPFGAFDRGISRMHAILKKTDKGLVIEDLASVNGSWLNSKRLQPYMPASVRSGDRVRLGQIEIEIHFDPSALHSSTDAFHAVAP